MQKYKKDTVRQEGQKSVLVVRYGAWGDHIMITPLLRQLRKDGYWVILNCSDKGYDIHKHSPFVDELWVQGMREVENSQIAAHIANLSKGIDKVIDLCGSIEGALLKGPDTRDSFGTLEYTKPKGVLHSLCNKNYQDQTMGLGGYPDMKGELPELHFTEEEEAWAKAFVENIGGFTVLIAMSGSSYHKFYPYMSAVWREFVSRHPDAHGITVGDAHCSTVEFKGDNLFYASGKWGIRKSLVLTKYVNLVISGETGVLNAASCYDTPKVALLSHSSSENLTKYFRNCANVSADMPCQPCHKLHYGVGACPLDSRMGFPVCMSYLDPDKVLEPMEAFYAVGVK